MPEDASLDDFLPDDGDEEPSAAVDSAADAPDDPTPGAPIEPATSTSRWSPDDTCTACDERAPRRWRDDGGLVCAACKIWSRD